MKYEFKEVERTIIKNAFSLDKYLKTLEIVRIDKDYEKYTKNFDAFYKIRRSTEWKKEYYEMLKENQNRKNITFKEIIEGLHSREKKYTNKNIEPSFSSKMLATINPNKPIWDKYVLKYAIDKDTIKKYENKKGEEKITLAIEIYKTIEEKYKKYLKDKEIQETIKQIRKILKEDNLTDTKILDYIIWINGKENNEGKIN